jgi:hypothetical protein
MMSREQDHYAVLDVPRNASDADIKRRYRALMREVHPDANARDPQATRKAARVNTAYETLGNAQRRREYDARTGVRGPTIKRDAKVYAHWAEQPDWEDIVVEHVPAKRPAHVHDQPPVIQPGEIEVDLAEFDITPRVRRTIAITNQCACTLKGDVSTSEPWVWGPVGRFEIAPGERLEFDIEVIGRKVRFPGLSRVLFVANDWTGVVPVKITGFQSKRRRVVPVTDAAYVRGRPRKWVRNR